MTEQLEEEYSALEKYFLIASRVWEHIPSLHRFHQCEAATQLVMDFNAAKRETGDPLYEDVLNRLMQLITAEQDMTVRKGHLEKVKLDNIPEAERHLQLGLLANNAGLFLNLEPIAKVVQAVFAAGGNSELGGAAYSASLREISAATRELLADPKEIKREMDGALRAELKRVNIYRAIQNAKVSENPMLEPALRMLESVSDLERRTDLKAESLFDTTPYLHKAPVFWSKMRGVERAKISIAYILGDKDGSTMKMLLEILGHSRPVSEPEDYGQAKALYIALEPIQPIFALHQAADRILRSQSNAR